MVQKFVGSVGVSAPGRVNTPSSLQKLVKFSYVEVIRMTVIFEWRPKAEDIKGSFARYVEILPMAAVFWVWRPMGCEVVKEAIGR